MDYHTVPRYAIAIRDPIKGWRQSKFKMTLRYAAIQYASEGLDWTPIWPSEQFFREIDIPLVGSAQKFQGRK